MAKAKKPVKKDTTSFIKKVASAGRGGDTGLAYLSPKARELLKKLGGAGTKNPKTGLKEYKAASRFAKARAEQEPLGRVENTSVSPAVSVSPAPLSTAPEFQTFLTAPDTIPRQVEPEVRLPLRGSAAADLQEFRPAPAGPSAAQQEAERQAAIRAQQEAAQQEAARQAQIRAQQEAAQQEAAAQAAAQEQARLQAEAAMRAQERERAAALINQQAQPSVGRPVVEQGTVAVDLQDVMRTQPTQDNEIITPQQPASQPQFQSPFTTQFDPSRLLQPGQALNAPAVSQEPVSEPVSTPAPGTAASDLSQFSNIAPASTGINLSGIGLSGSYMPGGPAISLNNAALAWDKARQDRDLEELERQKQEAARRAAEEEARRIAAEEEARRKAEEEAARRAAEEAAKRAAEEEARRRAEEQARWIAEQEAKARLAAEEARRVAAEAEQRRLADEAARQRALQDAAARQAAEQEAARRAQEDAARRAQEEDAARAAQQEAARQAQEQASRQVQEQAARQQEEARRAAEEQARSTAAEEARKQGEAQKLMDEERKRLAAEQERRRELSARFSNLSSVVDPNSDVGRLLSRFREATGAGRGPSSLTGGTTGEISPIAQQAGGIPTSSGSIPLPTSPISGAAGTSIPTTQIPTPGYQAAPLPQLVGAGTSTPFFQPSAGGLTPGTLPASQMPQSLRTSDIPLQAIAMNPNLTPTILGGAENLGYYMDRNGNIILSPGGVRPPGRAKGGPASDAELEQLLKDAEVDKDMSSAKAMLDELSSEPAQSKTEVSYSPNAQSIRRVSRRPIREETDRGTARGMAMELEQITKAQGPRAKGVEKKMELLRDTLGMPTFSRAGLARAGDLMAKRFAEGGAVEEGGKSEARKKFDELRLAAREFFSTGTEETGSGQMGPMPAAGRNTRRYFEEAGEALRGSPPTGIEREAQIRSKMGPEYRDLVEKVIGETAMIGGPTREWNLQGANFPADVPEERRKSRIAQRLGEIAEASGQEIPEDKRIFALGRKAIPQIYAHEMRHERVDNEEYNRVMDLVNAGSMPAYRDRVDALYRYQMSRDPRYTEADFNERYYLANEVPFQDKERYVLNEAGGTLRRYLSEEGKPLMMNDNWGEQVLRANYNLNARGAQGAFMDTGEKLRQKTIELRARYPFLNFVGRENAPAEEGFVPFPDLRSPDARAKPMPRRKKQKDE